MKRVLTAAAFACAATLVHAANPWQNADMVGRDLNVPLLGSIGHVGLWSGAVGYVIEMLDEATPLQQNTLANFKSRTSYWGASYYSSLMSRPNVQVCNNIAYCDNLISYAPDYALQWQASLWWAAGATYTTTVFYTHPQPGGWYTPESPPWGPPAQPVYKGPTMGQFRCDTFVREVWRTGNTVPVASFPGTQLPNTMFYAFSIR